MSSIAHSSVTIQTSAESVPSTPSWFGEVSVITHFFKQQGVLAAIEEQVRFARRRFGHFDTIDFVAVLLGYAISGERTLETFYEGVQPFATAFMALFGRERLPHRSTLSRFLSALDQTPVEALRMLFLKDLLARPLQQEESTGGLWDRAGSQYLVFDVDGTRQAARQRALAASPDLPPAQRRFEEVERDGSLRVLYAACIGHCHPCPLRGQCQESPTTLKARRVSAVYWPLSSSSPTSDPSPPPPRSPSAASFAHPVLWKDWPRCLHRREVVKRLSHQRVDIALAEPSALGSPPPARPLTRAQRAHCRLCCNERLARNARSPASASVSIRLFGIPTAFAQAIGLSRP